MQCLWCNQGIVSDLTWNMLVFSRKPSRFCASCANQLEKLSGNQCARCGCMGNVSICDDCRQWERYYNTKDVLTANHSIFVYNQMMRDVITKWKYRGDYVLGNLFRPYAAQFYQKYCRILPKRTIIVPIPLSDERKQERGFNQAKMLADFLPLPQIEILARTHHEKQSKKTKKQRLHSENPFYQADKINKTVLLVDDIYTTGTTLRHAAEVLKQNGCPEVYGWTLIRG